MTETLSGTSEAPKTMKQKSLCLMLDEDIVNGIEHLRDVFDFPIEAMLSDGLRLLTNTYSPLADLHEQGKLTMQSMPDIQKAIESLLIKGEVAKVKFDKKYRNLKQTK